MKNYFSKPPFSTLPQSKDRWTPIYLEYGRLEVDDSSLKWIQSDGLLCRIPVASVSAILMGAGTSITHAAIMAAADSNTPIIWVSKSATKYIAYGTQTNANNTNARLQAKVYGNRNSRTQVARKMFSLRFGEEKDIRDKTINELRGMEGIRWRKVYKDIADKYGVYWNRRDYDVSNWEDGDDINKAISMANAVLHSLCSAIILNMGYLPQIGFLHDSSVISFSCDIADIFKKDTSLDAAFSVIGSGYYNSDNLSIKIIEKLKLNFESAQTLKKIPKVIEYLFKDYQ
ncbi:MAG: type I-E CRISPR-associated endonuclease Cas1e [Opitutales bacterium]